MISQICTSPVLLPVPWTEQRPKHCAKLLLLLALLFLTSYGMAQEKPAAPAAIDGVKGVKQEAVESVKKVEPPAATNAAIIESVKGVKQDAIESVKKVEPPTASAAAAAASAAQGVNKVEGVNTVNGVKADGQEVVMAIPPPPSAGSATNVEGSAVGAVSSIQAVKGVQGIDAPKQQNLEAALLIKEGGTPTGPAKAAAALLNGPPGQLPGKQKIEDGRAGFQEFEKLTMPGS